MFVNEKESPIFNRSVSGLKVRIINTEGKEMVVDVTPDLKVEQVKVRNLIQKYLVFIFTVPVFVHLNEKYLNVLFVQVFDTDYFTCIVMRLQLTNYFGIVFM